MRRFLREAPEDRLPRRNGEGSDGNGEPPWISGLADENRRVIEGIEMEFERLPREDSA